MAHHLGLEWTHMKGSMLGKLRREERGLSSRGRDRNGGGRTASSVAGLCKAWDGWNMALEQEIGW